MTIFDRWRRPKRAFILIRERHSYDTAEVVRSRPSPPATPILGGYFARRYIDASNHEGLDVFIDRGLLIIRSAYFGTEPPRTVNNEREFSYPASEVEGIYIETADR